MIPSGGSLSEFALSEIEATGTATIVETVGSSSGTSTVTGVGQAQANSVGSSAGASVVSGVGAAMVFAVGSSTGTSTATGISDNGGASPNDGQYYIMRRRRR